MSGNRPFSTFDVQDIDVIDISNGNICMTIDYIKGALANGCHIKLNCSDYGDLLINHDIIGTTGCINDVPIDGETTCVLKGYDKVDDVIENLNGPAVVDDVIISGELIVSTELSQVNPSVSPSVSISVSPTVSPDPPNLILVVLSVIVTVIVSVIILLLIAIVIKYKKNQKEHAIKPHSDNVTNNNKGNGNDAELIGIHVPRTTTPDVFTSDFDERTVSNPSLSFQGSNDDRGSVSTRPNTPTDHTLTSNTDIK